MASMPTTPPAIRIALTQSRSACSRMRLTITIATAISSTASTPVARPTARSRRDTDWSPCGSWITSTPAVTSAKPASCIALSRSSRNRNASRITNGL